MHEKRHAGRREGGDLAGVQYSQKSAPGFDSWLGTEYRARGITKRLRPGSVNLRRKNCALVPTAGRRLQFFLLIFTKTCQSLLGVPCTPPLKLTLTFEIKIWS